MFEATLEAISDQPELPTGDGRSIFVLARRILANWNGGAIGDAVLKNEVLAVGGRWVTARGPVGAQ